MPKGVHIPEVFRYVRPSDTSYNLLCPAKLLYAVHFEIQIDHRTGHNPSSVPGAKADKGYRERQMQDVERFGYPTRSIYYGRHASRNDPFHHELTGGRFRFSRERNRPKTIL